MLVSGVSHSDSTFVFLTSDRPNKTVVSLAQAVSSKEGDGSWKLEWFWGEHGREGYINLAYYYKNWHLFAIYDQNNYVGLPKVFFFWSPTTFSFKSLIIRAWAFSSGMTFEQTACIVWSLIGIA